MSRVERSRVDIQTIYLNEYNDPLKLVKSEHVVSRFLQTFTDNELELFIKTIDETYAQLKSKGFNSHELPNVLSIKIPQGYNAEIVKKLIHASDRVGKLILEARIDIQRYIRVLFTFDNDDFCKATIYTFGFEKKYSQKDVYTDTYGLATQQVHKLYIENKLNEGTDYYEG